MTKIMFCIFAFFIGGSAITAHAGEAAEVVKKYFSFFNSGENEDLEDFRSCVVPEERDSMTQVPSRTQREKSPVGQIYILKEEYDNDICTVVFRCEKRDGLRLLCLEKRDGQWLLSHGLSGKKYDQLLLDFVRKPSAQQQSVTSRQSEDATSNATNEAQTPVPITLGERYQHAKKRLEELKKEPLGQNRRLRTKKIRMREEQLRRIARQMAVRRKAINLDLSQFDTRETEDFKKRLEEYLKGKSGYGYNRQDYDFMQGLVRELKSGKINPNVEITDARYDRHSGPLINFILSGRTACQTEVATELIRLGADTSVVSMQNMKRYDASGAVILCQGGVDELNDVLLHYLSRHPMKQQVVSDLLFLNHNVTERDKQGNTALHLAARAGNKNIAEQIICLDADVNAANYHGQTPLFEAMKYGDDTLVSLLLEAGADRFITDDDGKRAEDYENIGKFRIAVSTNNINAAGDLLNQGVSPDTIFGTGDTALQTACLRGHIQMVKLLLERGADPDLSGSRWYGSKTTPAQMVFFNRPERNAQIFSLLLQKGADPNKPPIGYGGITMLEILCSTRVREDENRYLEALLSAKNIRRDKFGRCMSRALKWGKSERFIEIFLAHVDTFAPGEVVLTQQNARKYSQFLIRMLIQKGVRYDKPEYPQAAVERQFAAQRHFTSRSMTDRAGDVPDWLPGPSGQWHVRMDTALAAAGRERKKIFVLSTGSDWCGWCKKLYNEVLSTPDFIDLAKRKMILVYLDNPHSKAMPASKVVQSGIDQNAEEWGRCSVRACFG